MNAKHQDKVKELVESFSATLLCDCERLYRSGMIDVEAFDPDHFALAKILISAAIQRNSEMFLQRADLKAIKNLANL